MEYNYLYIYTNNDQLYQQYIEYVNKHNYNVLHTQYPNAGFDLFNPDNIDVHNSNKVSLNSELVCSMENYLKQPLSYYLYPRSSLSKSSFRFANSVGIIDSGYRGNIIAMFDVINYPAQITKYERLIQICSPDLKPIIVSLVDSLEELGTT